MRVIYIRFIFVKQKDIMGVITIDVSERDNQPPSSGWVEVSVDYNTEYTLTLANFTTETTPPYSDPEGDDLDAVKITTLPNFGEIRLNNIAISVDDEISHTDISAGNLTYVPVNDANGYSSAAGFAVSDQGSLTFTTVSYKFIFNVDGNVNQAPSNVGNGSADLFVGETFVFTRASLTSQLNPPYSDPEGDSAENLLVVTVPTAGKLELNGITVISNQVISFTDIDSGLLTYFANEYPSGGIEGFTFMISDSGSGEYRG